MEIKCLSFLDKYYKKPKKVLSRLEIQVIISLALGVWAGVFLGENVESIKWMGDLFMTGLKMFLAPLLFLAIINAVLGLGDIKKLGNLGGRTIAYYMMTTTLAILLSIILMNIFKPGVGASFKEFENFNSAGVEGGLTFSGFVLSLFPENIVVSFVEMNAIQIITIGLILGIFIIKSASKNQTSEIKNLFDTLYNAILEFIRFVVKLTPFGIFAIVANIVAVNGIHSMIDLLPLVIITLIALLIHACITLPTIGIILGKFNPWIYFKQVKEAILLGFSTSSSSATMGVSMSVAKEKAKLNDEVVDFTFPIGTTVNMDGTALYQALVALFVAQVLGIDLSLAQQFTIVVIVILASVGAAGIPGAGIIILTTVFITVGLPVEAIAIVLAIDRILDMFRTSVNVWGDMITAKVIDTYYIKYLEKKSIAQKMAERIQGDREETL